MGGEMFNINNFLHLDALKPAVEWKGFPKYNFAQGSNLLHSSLKRQNCACTLGVFSPMQNHDFDTWFKNCLHAWFKHFLHSDTSRRAAASKQSTGYRSIAVY